ncbi:MAG: UV DNA damage repair endonuclease UvsE [Candidatus Omnitrophica bacterium]|nr:UV DNA damage repair endonuclease UvsE [Candidatus Omnitrophota bacterium]MBD3269509.1 UV DNA damage repair endonuclease UvsE [Candidatus Omnitrophota bacterium]
MKIGYPCINRSLSCSSARTFRLKSYSQERLIETINNNLICLLRILEYNVKNNIFFFRITSDLIPFASHPVCRLNWPEYFFEQLNGIGRFIKKNNIRISMHPDQFTLINSVSEEICERSVKELAYHSRLLDTMELDSDAKIQIHLGGVYGNKILSRQRFLRRYELLPPAVKKRLVIENDESRYALGDCFWVNRRISIPVLADFFHHRLNKGSENFKDIFPEVVRTWKKKDGLPMVDYSSAGPNRRRGSHAESIDLKDFSLFIKAGCGFDFDIMLEIKDKEQSALKAVEALRGDKRFYEATDTNQSNQPEKKGE